MREVAQQRLRCNQAGRFPKTGKAPGPIGPWIKSEVEQWAVQCIRTSRRDSKP